MRLFLALLIVSLFGCAEKRKSHARYVTERVPVVICKVVTGKYSKVEGMAYFRGLPVPIDNGGTGYYYKKYNLNEGTLIYKKITFGISREGDKTEISCMTDLDVKEYEL